MRVFIAINLPKEIKEKLAEIQNQLKTFDLPIRWVKPENIHLTLVFLGHIKENKVAEVTEVTKATVGRFKSFDIQIKDLEVFPDERRPRLISIGVKEGQHLLDLQSSLEKGLHEAGFSLEERKFSPHLTLGRIKEKVANLKNLTQKMGNVDLGMYRVEKVNVMESRLSEEGSRYLTIRSIKL